MKKLLLILLSLIMCISAFASCDTETDNSSDASAESNSESSVGITESSTNVSDTSSVVDDSSDASTENVSNSESEVGIEKVIYFDGEYCFENNKAVSQGIVESFSHKDEKYPLYTYYDWKSLIEFLEDGGYDKDSYFLVGLKFNGDTSECFDYLSDLEFIIDEDNMFIESNNPISESYDAMTDEEKMNERRRRFEATLPDVNLKPFEAHLYYEELPYFDTVGYITADAINELRNNKSFGVEITWFPSPDNQELWLTGFYAIPVLG